MEEGYGQDEVEVEEEETEASSEEEEENEGSLQIDDLETKALRPGKADFRFVCLHIELSWTTKSSLY